MGKQRRKFSAEFKKQVIQEVESGLSLNEAARRHQISTSLISTWRDLLRHGNLVDKPSKREKTLEKEIERYKAKVAELLMENDVLKKISPMEPAPEKARFIRDHRQELGGISKGCRVLKLPRSTYYSQLKKRSDLLEQEDQALKGKIEEVRLDLPGYGYRRLHEHFKRQGQTINEKRIRRVVKKYGLYPVVWKTFKVRTTQCRQNLPVFPSLDAAPARAG